MKYLSIQRYLHIFKPGIFTILSFETLPSAKVTSYFRAQSHSLYNRFILQSYTIECRMVVQKDVLSFVCQCLTSHFTQIIRLKFCQYCFSAVYYGQAHYTPSLVGQIFIHHQQQFWLISLLQTWSDSNSLFFNFTIKAV